MALTSVFLDLLIPAKETATGLVEAAAGEEVEEAAGEEAAGEEVEEVVGLDLPLYSPIKDVKPNADIKTAKKNNMHPIILKLFTKLIDC